ncbi:unnamed protein product [Pleuronectes platessa]|uniref:Secreted protein n=1 Tax=Pleuronectes platessa TaxID=8262 RepID=A0A9N7TQ49_PLEPL|nr:unnamed protein product [Pleuronectes platessa]
MQQQRHSSTAAATVLLTLVPYVIPEQDDRSEEATHKPEAPGERVCAPGGLSCHWGQFKTDVSSNVLACGSSEGSFEQKLARHFNPLLRNIEFQVDGCSVGPG